MFAVWYFSSEEYYIQNKDLLTLHCTHERHDVFGLDIQRMCKNKTHNDA